MEKKKREELSFGSYFPLLNKFNKRERGEKRKEREREMAIIREAVKKARKGSLNCITPGMLQIMLRNGERI